MEADRLRTYAEVQGRDDSLSYSGDNENRRIVGVRAI